MRNITITTDLHAPIERCFDLAGHRFSRAIACTRPLARDRGRTVGLIELGEAHELALDRVG